MTLNLTRREVIWLTLGFLAWRLVLFFIGSQADRFLEYAPTFPYSNMLDLTGYPRWFYSWANFDGVHYRTIIDRGYVGTGLIQAFFPLYPILSKSLNSLLHDSILAAGLVSNACALGVCYIWYSLSKQYFGVRVAIIATLMMATFPGSLFLGAVYTESLFLLLVLGTFLAAKHQVWWLAGLLAALASATRIVGIALLPALFIELCLQNWYQKGTFTQRLLKTLRKLWKVQKTPLLMIALGGMGLVLYMTYLKLHFQDPWYFFHVQSEFGTGRQEGLVPYPQVIWRYFKILATYRPFNNFYFVLLQEFIIGLAVPVILVITALDRGSRIRWSWWWFTLLVFVVPTLTGTFSGLTRYILPGMVIFWYVSQKLSSRTWLTAIYLLFSTVILVINTILFIQGYWVA